MYAVDDGHGDHCVLCTCDRQAYTDANAVSWTRSSQIAETTSRKGRRSSRVSSLLRSTDSDSGIDADWLLSATVQRQKERLGCLNRSVGWSKEVMLHNSGVTIGWLLRLVDVTLTGTGPHARKRLFWIQGGPTCDRKWLGPRLVALRPCSTKGADKCRTLHFG